MQRGNLDDLSAFLIVAREGSFTKAAAKLGNGHTKFYAIGNGANYASAFHDVTSGSNGGFAAGTGYDDVTGWGSYNGAGLAAALG